jgi:hypothetical protein
VITPRYTGPEVDPHVAWTKVKASAMKRPYLDCGCRNDGVTDTYLHLGCARIACKAHADDPHECQHYEPQSPPRELLFPPEDVERIDHAVRQVDEVLRATAYPRADELPPIHPDQPMDEFLQSYAAWCRALDPLREVNATEGDDTHVATVDPPADPGVRFERVESGGESTGPVSFAVDVSRDGTGTVAAATADGHLMIVAETHDISEEELERFAVEWRSSRAGGDAALRTYWLNELARSEPDAPLVDAALDPALDHSSHSMQWVDGCPECPSLQDRPERRTAAVTDLGRSTEVDAVPLPGDREHWCTNCEGVGIQFCFFNPAVSPLAHLAEEQGVSYDRPSLKPRRPWWRFW